MSDAVEPSERYSPRAQGRVLRAVNRTWPGFISGAAEGRARELIEEERYGEAVEVLEKGVERYGAASVSALLLAWCLYMAERPAEAREWIERAVLAEPDNADAHWMRGNICFALDDDEEGFRSLQEAIVFAPENGRFYMQLAWTGHRNREFAETRELVEQAVELEPDDPWVQLTAGRIYDYHFRHRLAQVHIRRALELDPGAEGAWRDLAELLQVRGRLSSGVRVAWKTVNDAVDAEAGDAALVDAWSLYEETLRRWSWRWYEWALRAALVLNVIDWILPTPFAVGAVLSGVLVAVYAAGWVRSLLVMPAECRRDLVGKGRRGHFAGAVFRTLLVLGGIALVLLGELNALQHLGILAIILGGYVEWYWRAAKISGRRRFGPEPEE